MDNAAGWVFHKIQLCGNDVDIDVCLTTVSPEDSKTGFSGNQTAAFRKMWFPVSS